ncbi:MAG TPA: VOC family protein [Acidimicrobiales bacterium]|jgi:catechol 2,3-dioxygenase-like lactoylglutathione lyase family enzyme|nr:VOC family protein [Acidimicrobiales bacterium]HJM96848.1 VOC family protein [Acidimicrobiales bacterium]
MFNFQDIYHIGIRVPSLSDAMEEMGDSLEVTWAEPVETSGQSIWTPEDGQMSLPLKFVYSCEGPQHIELLEGPKRSIWDGRIDSGVHHVGVWVDDVAQETERFISQGWTLLAAGVSPDKGYGGYTYVAPPSGTIVELVTAAIKPRFEQWWAGGPFAK